MSFEGVNDSQLLNNPYFCHRVVTHSFKIHSFKIDFMNGPSLIFWIVFAIPLFAFLIWLMRQDKKKGITGLVVVLITIVVAVVYMYVKTGGK